MIINYCNIIIPLGNNETASTNVQAFDTFLMHLAERFPHIMEAILQDQEILDLARCLQVSKAMRRAVATVLRGKSRGSILLRRRTDKSSMRLAAKRDNGFLYLSKFGDHDHPNRKPILELDYGLLTPFAKEGPQANLCFGVDGTYLIADSHLVGIHVLRDSGEIISTVRGPWALAKTLRQDDDGHFLDSPAYSTNSMKVHFVGTNPPSKTSAEENERKKVFLVEHCWNEKEFSPVEISCSPDSWTFLTGKKMASDLFFEFSKGAHNFDLFSPFRSFPPPNGKKAAAETCPSPPDLPWWCPCLITPGHKSRLPGRRRGKSFPLITLTKWAVVVSSGRGPCCLTWRGASWPRCSGAQRRYFQNCT